MKKVVFVLAAAGLMSLAACSKQTPAENATDATANALDNAGENLEDMAENTSNDTAAAALDNAADNAHDKADAVEFFAPCTDATVSPKPFQCLPEPQGLPQLVAHRGLRL